MKFFAPNLDSTNADVYKTSGVEKETELNDFNEPEILDNGWVQTNDSDDFNNYIEEY